MVRCPAKASGVTVVLAAGVFLACGGHPAATFDSPPQLANRDEVTSALRAMGGGLQAQVTLMLHVTDEGRVSEVRVFQSSGDDELDDAARWVGERMRFEPARFQGKPVAAWIRMPVKFDVVSPRIRGPRLRNADALSALIASDYGDLNGTVRVRVRVNEDGMVTRMRDIRGADRKLARAVQELTKEMRFWPALDGHRPTGAWVNCVLKFAGPASEVSLDQESSD